MVRKNKRLLFLVISCSLAGVILGGTASWAESNTCLRSDNISAECITKDPLLRTVEGMSSGLVAGAFAAICAAWQVHQQD